MPMYITDTLELDKSQIALIPFISFISGFCATFPLRYLSKYLGTYITYLIGSFLILCCSILFWYNDIICGSKAITTIIAAVLLGSGSSVILVSSLSLTADLIGKNTGSSAFVFGCMSFIDKLSNGIAVAALQQFSPCPSSSDNIMCNCRHYYHYIMSDLPIACTITAVLALIILYLLKPKRPISSKHHEFFQSKQKIFWYHFYYFFFDRTNFDRTSKWTLWYIQPKWDRSNTSQRLVIVYS